MNKIKFIIFSTLLCAATACTQYYEEYNTNPTQPTSVPAVNLLSTMFEGYGQPQQNNCQFMNCMWACYSGHVAAVANWNLGTNIYAYYNPSDNHNSSTFSILFGQVYPSYYYIQEQTNEQGAVYAIALLSRVYNMHQLASLQGPIPYTKVENGQLEAGYDDEETAWHAMFEDLDKAIQILSQVSVNNDLASIDQFYGGDCTKWLRFANTLKLRMAIRISNAPGMADFARNAAEEAVTSGVMTSTGHSCWNTTNGKSGANGFAIQWMTEENKANACLVSYMNGYNDPRRPAYFQTASTGGYVGARFGSTQIPTTSTYNGVSKLKISDSQQNPMPVMYAAEAAFLMAEGALKGWNMGDTPESLYKKGIELSFEEFGISGVENYLNSTSLPGSHTDRILPADSYTNKSTVCVKWNNGDSDDVKLEKILTQKWIALYLDPLNGWSDYRRTGYPQLFPSTMSSNANVSTTRGARRLRFPLSEYNTNTANVHEAVLMIGGQDNEGVDLWWALKQ